MQKLRTIGKAAAAGMLAALLSGCSGRSKEMITACENGDLETVKALLAENPKLVNAKGSVRLTALHWAVAKGHVELTEYLIEHGADLNAESLINHQTPLDLAMAKRKDGTIAVLKRHGAKQYKEK